MYDLIGDIHGYADNLIELLEHLGYRIQDGVYRHSERTVIFLGDFIDRGPKIAQVLHIVRSMVESGSALTVMGNHELNALAYHTEDPESPGDFLRRHSPQNNHQISRTLHQLTEAELQSALEWFRTMPLWLDLDGLRVVHACWDEHAIARVKPSLEKHGGLTEGFVRTACRPGKELFDPIETLLKGKEVELPDGIQLIDTDGHVRKTARVRWYLPPAGHTFETYTLTDKVESDLPIEEHLIDEVLPYPKDVKPVFFGHYSFIAPKPQVLADNVACLDYGIAKGGWLCAYRWDGEQTLSNGKFDWLKRERRAVD